jgi:hypothetical protein
MLPLVREIQQNQHQIDNKLDEIQRQIERLSGEMNTRFAETSRALSGIGYKIDVLNKGRLQTEADQQALLQRLTELESRVPDR